MKKDILKIAGVKSEKEFYKKFPTEDAFMAKHGGAFHKAKRGNKLSKADFGADLTKLDSSLSGMGGIAGASTQLIGGVQQLIEEGKQKKKLEQSAKLSELALEAGTPRDLGSGIKYVRPEDTLVNPGETGDTDGTGYDFLQMENGGFIGGNPTEIQNMYNPGDLYSDLGYEPLNDSARVKQFAHGGKAFYGMETTGPTTTMSPFNATNFGQIGSFVGSAASGGGGQQSGASQIGSAVGGIAGMAFGPVGSMFGSALGGFVGGAIGGNAQQKREALENKSQLNSGILALRQSLKGSANAEHGGELKYLSHNWQPQTITKFGDYNMKDLLAPPKDADMLRAGGNLKKYTPLSARAMSTERPMQMGGDLTIDNRGDIDFLGYNPETAKTGASGYIGITRGPSHDNGGFNLNYSGSGVEVEGNETVIERKEGGPVDGNKSLVILGDMKTGAFGNEILEGVNERLAKKVLKGKKIEDVKFKQLGNQVAKLTGRLNKSESKFIDLADSVDGNSSFDLLQLNTAKTALSGINMQYKGLNKFQQNAIDVQSGYHDAAEERGYNDTPKFLLDIKKGKIKSSDMAKFGKNLKKAQFGEEFPENYTDVWGGAPTKLNLIEEPQTFGNVPQEGISAPFQIFPIVPDKKEDKFDLLGLANQLSPFTRPLLKNPLDPGQLSPEMLALATNVVDPVYAQQFSPLLEQTPTVSFRDQLNEIQAEANAARRLVGNNPSAQSAISAQAANAKIKVLGEEMRTNQMMQLESRRRNLATLNDATLKNFAILDQQQVRQSQAKSATKAQAQLALNSIADKIARNKAETLQANIMSNMYPQYTFGPKGRIYNTGFATFNTDAGYANTPTDAKGDALLPIYGNKGNITGYKVKQARNGSIVKAIKNL